MLSKTAERCPRASGSEPATDKEALLKAVMFGFASAANSPLAPVNEGYDKTLNDYPWDLDKAKALLKRPVTRRA